MILSLVLFLIGILGYISLETINSCELITSFCEVVNTLAQAAYQPLLVSPLGTVSLQLYSYIGSFNTLLELAMYTILSIIVAGNCYVLALRVFVPWEFEVSKGKNAFNIFSCFNVLLIALSWLLNVVLVLILALTRVIKFLYYNVLYIFVNILQFVSRTVTFRVLFAFSCMIVNYFILRPYLLITLIFTTLLDCLYIQLYLDNSALPYFIAFSAMLALLVLVLAPFVKINLNSESNKFNLIQDSYLSRVLFYVQSIFIMSIVHLTIVFSLDYVVKLMIILLPLLGLVVLLSFLLVFASLGISTAVTHLSSPVLPRFNLGFNNNSFRYSLPHMTRFSGVRHYSSKAVSFSQNMSNLVREANEVDTGQHTTNPHIVVQRLIARGGPYTLEDLHSVQSLVNVPLMSKKDFDNFTSIPGKEYSLPLSGSRSALFGPIRNVEDRTMKGIYVFTNLITNEQRVGSSMVLTRRLYQHLSNHSQGSKILQSEIKKYGVENFKLTVYILPFDVTFPALYGLEQYYMIALNPSYSQIKVVYSFGTATLNKDNHKAYKATEEQLLKVRLLKGRAFSCYRGDELLYVCLSLSEYQSLSPNINSARDAYYNNIDKDTSYKQSLSFRSTPLNCVSIPAMDSGAFKAYLQELHSKPQNLSARKNNSTSNELEIIVTPNLGSAINLICKSSRDAVVQLKSMGYNTSRWQIDKQVGLYKATNTPVSFTIGEASCVLTVTTSGIPR